MTTPTNNNTTINKFQTKGTLKQISGSIIQPQGSGLMYVPINISVDQYNEHPLYKLFDKKWKQVKSETKQAYLNKNGHLFKIGVCSNDISVQSDVVIKGMICQKNNKENGKIETNKDAVEKCLQVMSKEAKQNKASIHLSQIVLDVLPELTAELVEKHFINNGINVFMYDEKQLIAQK